MSDYDLNLTPNSQGTLHSLQNETANCGMGAIVQLDGKTSHNILDYTLCSVSNMIHRGAVDADMKTGDGSGFLAQLPHDLFSREAEKLGTKGLSAGELGVGVFFFPTTHEDGADAIQKQIQSTAESTLKKRGLTLIGWRECPVNPDELGKIAQASRPNIQHLLIQRPADCDEDHFERLLFLTRREIEKTHNEVQGFYIPTLSCRLISYKALAMPSALRAFYSDLQDSDFKTCLSLYHQRFSTNTFPAWPLGQPFRRMCHNGEINTVRGNRNWWASREEFFASDIWGDDVDLLKDVMSHNESDSASLDHALEVLLLSGRSLEHAMCMLVPPAYRHNNELPDNVKAFYEFHRCYSEPWDGPAGLVYTDGKKVCASLDRNGLRPSRFTLTESGLLYIGSESGALPLPDDEIVSRGRLGPGQMLSADTTTGTLKFDKEIKEELAAQNPYRQWIDDNALQLRNFITPEPASPQEEAYDSLTLSRIQVTNGLSAEDVDMVFPPMMKNAQEAIYSMGDDIPLAPLSLYPRLLFSYFRQLFAQVTNPPIDPIREWSVMSLSAGLGPERNLLTNTPEHAKIIQLESAILFEQELSSIKKREEQGFLSRTLDITWDASEGAGGMKVALDHLCKKAEQAVDEDINILILSDRATSAERIPIPSMLAVGAVHHHLNRCRKRLRASLVIETAEARDTHQLACLFGFGATAICPYLGYATVRQIANDPTLRKKSGLPDELTAEDAMGNYRKSLEKGILKIMSKMGISVLNSYQGAQIFEALGIGSSVVDYAFTGTHSRIGGVGFSQLADDSIIRHNTAFKSTPEDGQATLDLKDPGYNRYRKSGERHAIPTEVVSKLHTYMKSAQQDDFNDYSRATRDVAPVAVKHLLDFVPKSTGPIPIDQVEPIEDIRKRFTTAAMSMGALSPEAHETLAIAMNEIGAKSDSGEGGEDARRFTPYPNGDLARSAIKQVASGRFGVSANYLVNCDEIEIKMAQGAKPGEGGQLPGHKVNGIIARLRNTQPGVQLISPPPHHDIYSIEDLAQLIHDLKEINPAARITVKLVAAAGVGTIAAGCAKANADNILISGHDGGTAASPLSSIKHAGLPWELGLSEAQQTLMLNNLRDRVLLRTDGGFKNGRDVVLASILGAEEYNFGTIAMVAMGCVYVRKCHLNNCPVGVATTDPKWRGKFNGKPEHVINFFNGVAQEAREIMASIGVAKIQDLIGHPELLKQIEIDGHAKANSLDLSAVLKPVKEAVGGVEPARFRTYERNEGINKPTLDRKILEDLPNQIAELNDRAPVELSYDVVNTDRNIGTRLSGRIAEVHGDNGLNQGAVNLTFKGSAGQSFGTFLVDGVTLKLIGEGNDYVGKGMAGGLITVQPPADISSDFDPAKNSIVGNTCLYGAIGGKLFINGRAGERFAVRNSGSTAVVEGVGDHGCEYMTNGLIAILGLTGQNFGAGMSGGTAYIYDIDGQFQSRTNKEMIVALPVQREQDINEIKELIEKQAELTGSARAKQLLEDWPTTQQKLIRVIPKERHALEKAEQEHEAATQQPTTA